MIIWVLAIYSVCVTLFSIGAIRALMASAENLSQCNKLVETMLADLKSLG